jgi:hypothetical protein
MSDENFRRDLNRVFDEVAGSPSSNLRERVRTAVVATPERRGTYWIAAVAAVVIATLLVGVLVVSGPLRRGVTPVAAPQATPSPQVTPSAEQTPSPSATPSQQPAYSCLAQSFVFKATTPPTPTPPVAFISAIRTGTHNGYDRVTVEFANGVPHDVQVSAPFDGTNFTLSPSGRQVTLKGSRGLLVVIHGSDLHTSYSGPTDIITGDPTLAEVRQVEDFEGVVQLGLGVNGTGCYRVTLLTNPDRLVIDVQAA